MRDMERSLLLGVLGWPERSNIEGAACWSKASADLLSSVSYRVSQDETSVRASLDLEDCDDNFETVKRPLLLADFVLNARGRMQLARFVKNGVEQTLGDDAQPAALEDFARAKATLTGKPKLALLGAFGPSPGAAPGAKL